MPQGWLMASEKWTLETFDLLNLTTSPAEDCHCLCSTTQTHIVRDSFHKYLQIWKYITRLTDNAATFFLFCNFFHCNGIYLLKHHGKTQSHHWNPLIELNWVSLSLYLFLFAAKMVNKGSYYGYFMGPCSPPCNSETYSSVLSTAGLSFLTHS